ncbi:hypothetical protein [Pseudooctadecabacter jejudonensis]|uniref:Uncharacterized protein n=1 Tax=Pseudooctadecabacter jejudonensis TaxID=1391910 RepID=A0A1Y5R8T9_9RHOB|nr:hypothetical protein [Pseudooctadecabacter jejudonensis]SLN10716.1 hypothetical protein PSJ8397_00037 [Pseudooctadecabacter jejudonensis]
MAYSFEQLKDRAAHLLTHKRMGSVQLAKTVTTAGASPFDPPSTSTVYQDVPAVVVGVSADYVTANNQVKSTDLSVTTLLPDVLPNLGDTVRVNGQDLSVVQVKAIPHGEPVALHMIVTV